MFSTFSNFNIWKLNFKIFLFKTCYPSLYTTLFFLILHIFSRNFQQKKSIFVFFLQIFKNFRKVFDLFTKGIPCFFFNFLWTFVRGWSSGERIRLFCCAISRFVSCIFFPCQKLISCYVRDILLNKLNSCYSNISHFNSNKSQASVSQSIVLETTEKIENNLMTRTEIVEFALHTGNAANNNGAGQRIMLTKEK